MITAEDINEFIATTVLTMDNETKEACDSLSEFEKKTIAATAYYFRQGYNQAQRSKMIRELQWANIWNR